MCRTESGHQGSAVARGCERLRGAGGDSWGTYLGCAGVAGGPSALEGCQGARVGGCSKPGGGGGSPRPYSAGARRGD